MSAVLKSVAERAIELISSKYGSLKNLPEEFRQVIWVTAYRASAIGLKIESSGGAEALTKSVLIDGGRDAREFESSILALEFLEQMVPIVRSGQPDKRRLMLNWRSTSSSGGLSTRPICPLSGEWLLESLLAPIRCMTCQCQTKYRSSSRWEYP